MKTDFPYTRDLVFVGGGHAHALVLRKWAMNPLAGVRVTVIDPTPTAAYSGMLPGFVAGHYDRDELNIDLVALSRFAGARLILGAVEGIDTNTKEIFVPGRPPIAYDVAAIDVGITSAMPSLPGFSEHGIPVKPLTPFARKWDNYRKGSGSKQIAVIGGGVAGAEVAMAMAHALKTAGSPYELRLIDRSSILTENTEQGREQLRQAMQDLGIEVIENADVVEVTANAVSLADGTVLPSTFTLGAAGAKAHDWQSKIGLETHDGFLVINPMLQTTAEEVFATGDCAHMLHAPRTKAGVYAVRQAPVLFDNLVAKLSGGTLQRYDPQKDYLKLISMGGQTALAEKWGRARNGSVLWRWKNRIDQKFMDQFRELPTMGIPKIPRTHAIGLIEALGDKPMCGGCGSKVGRGALREALAALPKTSRKDIKSILGDDAAILLTGGIQQVLTTDHLRAVTEDPVLMTKIAAIHALGDIWAMGGNPQAATATIILPRMTADLQCRTMSEIMQTAADVMGKAGAVIVGGHSSMGSELTIGFTITGLCKNDPVTIANAKDGDVVILTKPIGTGVILAAEMQSRAPGDVVASCFASMIMPQSDVANILKNAHAMTDLTGFGLAGHLAGIAESSGVAIEINMTDVPLLDGALDLAQKGFGSTLLSDNRSGAGPVFGASDALGDLMFDPQTAGGLLACVAADRADAIVKKLRKVGHPAAVIGKVVSGQAQITFH